MALLLYFKYISIRIGKCENISAVSRGETSRQPMVRLMMLRGPVVSGALSSRAVDDVLGGFYAFMRVAWGDFGYEPKQNYNFEY